MVAPPNPANVTPDCAAARRRIASAWLVDESQSVESLLQLVQSSEAVALAIATRAEDLIKSVRAQHEDSGVAQAFLHEYRLSSQEGVVLMCVAEALLRIPDAATADKFIEDKMLSGDWESHVGHSGSLLVNASTWGLVLTGDLLDWAQLRNLSILDTVRSVIARTGEPVIRCTQAGDADPGRTVRHGKRHR